MTAGTQQQETPSCTPTTRVHSGENDRPVSPQQGSARILRNFEHMVKQTALPFLLGRGETDPRNNAARILPLNDDTYVRSSKDDDITSGKIGAATTMLMVHESRLTSRLNLPLLFLFLVRQKEVFAAPSRGLLRYVAMD
jgi:hypothetical protein